MLFRGACLLNLAQQKCLLIIRTHQSHQCVHACKDAQNIQLMKAADHNCTWLGWTWLKIIDRTRRHSYNKLVITSFIYLLLAWRVVSLRKDVWTSNKVTLHVLSCDETKAGSKSSVTYKAQMRSCKFRPQAK